MSNNTSEYRQARDAFTGTVNGEPFVLKAGEVLPADDEIVRAYGDHFEPLDPDAEPGTVAPAMSYEQYEQQYGELIDVDQAAELLGITPESVRRRLRKFELPGVKFGDGPKAQWRIPKATLDRRMKRAAHQARIRESGIVAGYGPAGREAVVDAAADYFGWTEEEADAERRRLAERDRREELLARVERELSADPATRQRLEQLDEQEREEAEARELAARVRRAERIQKRAREILDEEDEGE